MAEYATHEPTLVAFVESCQLNKSGWHFLFISLVHQILHPDFYLSALYFSTIWFEKVTVSHELVFEADL